MQSFARLRAPHSRRLLVFAAAALLSVSAVLHATPAVQAGSQQGPTCSQQPAVIQPAAPQGYAVIDFTNACGQQVPLVVDVATNSSEWQTGLMGVTNLPPDQGELFDFAAANAGREIQFGFWMEDTPTNLSVAFVGSNGQIHEIDDMQAETTDVHMPAQPYLYAIEANQGWFADNDILPGSQVDLSAALALAGSSPRP
jgi:uncharacterized membrane protein (UPF0127 family)